MAIKIAIVSDANIAAMLAGIGDPALIEQLLNDVMAGARAFWIKRAGEKLSSSRRDYVNGIQDVVVDKLTASVSLLGNLPNMIEHGFGPYDMHSTLLGPQVPVVPAGSGMKGKHESKKHPGKFWRVIPFRHQTPGTAGQGGGVPMGKSYEGIVSDATALGRAIHKAAKQLAPTTGMPGGKTQWGDRLPEGMAPKLKPTHSTDIYAGMVRMQKDYKGATQNTYMTFRVISDNVEHKWFHPGYVGAHIADEVQQYVEKVAPAAFAALLTP